MAQLYGVVDTAEQKQTLRDHTTLCTAGRLYGRSSAASLLKSSMDEVGERRSRL